MHSIRYSWARESLQFTTCSRTPGRTICGGGKKRHTQKKKNFFYKPTWLLTITFPHRFLNRLQAVTGISVCFLRVNYTLASNVCEYDLTFLTSLLVSHNNVETFICEYMWRITHLFVLVHIDPLQLTEADQVGAHQDPQLLPLLLPLLPVSAVALVLHPHPQLVHFCKVEQDEVHGVVDVARHLLWAPAAQTVHVRTQSLTLTKRESLSVNVNRSNNNATIIPPTSLLSLFCCFFLLDSSRPIIFVVSLVQSGSVCCLANSKLCGFPVLSSSDLQQWPSSTPVVVHWSNTDVLCLLAVVWQDVAGALQEVVSQKQTPQWVLDAAAHFHKVLQNVLTRLREGTDIHHAHCDQKIPVERTEGGRAHGVAADDVTCQQKARTKDLYWTCFCWHSRMF